MFGQGLSSASVAKNNMGALDQKNTNMPVSMETSTSTTLVTFVRDPSPVTQDPGFPINDWHAFVVHSSNKKAVTLSVIHSLMVRCHGGAKNERVGGFFREKTPLGRPRMRTSVKPPVTRIKNMFGEADDPKIAQNSPPFSHTNVG